MGRARVAMFVATAVLAAACGSSSTLTAPNAEGETALGPTITLPSASDQDASTLPTLPPLPSVPPTAPPPPPVTVLAVGNLGRCDAETDEVAEALMLDAGLILAAGDLVDSAAAPADACFGLSSELQRIYAVPGDQDDDPAFANLVEQSLTNAEPEGWFVTTIGAWQLIGLNSRCEAAGGCDADSPQYKWLDETLRSQPAACRAVVWHDARFTSALAEDDANDMGAILGRLDGSGADLLITGSSPNYERLGPLRPNGVLAADGQPGMLHFNIGAGTSAGFDTDRQPGTSAQDESNGYVRFVLGPEGYTWEFVATSAGTSESDVGSGTC